MRFALSRFAVMRISWPAGPGELIANKAVRETGCWRTSSLGHMLNYRLIACCRAIEDFTGSFSLHCTCSTQQLPEGPLISILRLNNIAGGQGRVSPVEFP